jgi:AbrB family looped-hinge helix DNA binding protein
MLETRTKIGLGGRVVIPARYRKTIGAEVGDEVVLILDGGEVRVMTPREAIRQAQALVRKHIPSGRKLAAELIEERKKERERG